MCVLKQRNHSDGIMGGHGTASKKYKDLAENRWRLGRAGVREDEGPGGPEDRAGQGAWGRGGDPNVLWQQPTRFRVEAGVREPYATECVTSNQLLSCWYFTSTNQLLISWYFMSTNEQLLCWYFISTWCLIGMNLQRRSSS